jgi:hypothetical protein
MREPKKSAIDPDIPYFKLGCGKDLQQEVDKRVFSIRLPKQTEFKPEVARTFVEHLLTIIPRITLQIEATGDAILWEIVDFRVGANPAVIEQAVSNYFPDAEVDHKPLAAPAFQAPFFRYVIQFVQGEQFIFPLRYVEHIARLDPLIALVQQMNNVRAGERVVYTLHVANPAIFAPTQAEDMLSMPVTSQSSDWFVPSMQVQASYTSVAGQTRVIMYPPQDMQVFEERLQQPLYQCVLMTQIDAQSIERVRQLSVFDGHLQQFRHPNYNGLYWLDDSYPNSIEQIDSIEKQLRSSTLGILAAWIVGKNREWEKYSLILEPREIAALWHLPHREISASKVRWASKKQVLMPASMRGKREGVEVGVNGDADNATSVHLPYSTRNTPMMIVGKSGVGKSNLMHHMIHQDIRAGRSVVVIDPHSVLVHDVLQRSIPPEREYDVVVLDLANSNYPPPLNPLRGLGNEVAVARVVDILHKLYPDLSELPQTVDALENALITLRAQPDATLWDVDRLFSDDGYRSELLTKISDPVIRRFWQDEYNRLPKAQQVQISAPIARRLRRFYRNEALRCIICHPDGIDLGQLLQERKIILISLRALENTIPEQEQRLIGALIISRLQMAAMNGFFKDTTCYCYVDELQNFVTTSIDQVFSEARKYNLSMTMANQYLQQLRGEALQAAMGNAGALAVFQVGQEDARALVAYTRPGFDVDDLTSLDKYQAALWMRDEDKTESAFTLKTRPPIALPSDAEARETRIRAQSLKLYTPRTRQEVSDWLTDREQQHTSSGTDEEDWFDNTKK